MNSVQDPRPCVISVYEDYADIAWLEAACKKLAKDFVVLGRANLRVVRNDNNHPDTLALAFGESVCLALVADEWIANNRGLLGEIRLALNYFEYGWRARAVAV